MDTDDLPTLNQPNSEPELVHFFATTSVPTHDMGSTVMLYGDVLEITPTVRAASIDRNGNSWLDFVEMPAEQIRRWGSIRYAPGPWPADKPRLEPGSVDADEAAIAAHKQAFMIQDERAREAALKSVRMLYGLPPAANKTVSIEADRR